MSDLSYLRDFTRVMTSGRLLNIVLVYLGYILSIVSKRPVVLGQPFGISLEPVSWCNLSCTQCPVGLNNVRRGKKSIDPVSYRRIIDDVYRKTWYLMLYFQGEPLLHKDFISLVNYAASRKMYTVTSTNAQLISREMAVQLVESGLNRIIVSVEGTDQQTYAKYRRGGELEKVLSGIRYLVDSKRQLKKNHPYIVLQFLVFRFNQHQIDEVKDLGRNLGVDRIECKSAQLYPEEGSVDLLPDLMKYRRYNINRNGELEIRRRMLNRCRRLWETLVVTSDERVVPCCFDKEGEYAMEGKNRKEIWKSREFTKFRAMILHNRRSVDICTNCTGGLGRVIRSS